MIDYAKITVFNQICMCSMRWANMLGAKLPAMLDWGLSLA